MAGNATQSLAEFRAEARAVTGVGDESGLVNAELAEAARLDRKEQEFGEKSESIRGRMKLAFAASAGAAERMQDEQEAKSKAATADVLLVAMIAQLERDIEALEKEIEGYDKQIAAVEWLIENHKIIDPNDPDHMHLLELAGIPKDEWGTVTVEQLQAQLDKLETAKNEAQENLNASTEEYNALIKIRNESPSADKYSELTDRLDDLRDKILNNRSSEVGDQIRWFKLADKKLEVFSDVDEQVSLVKEMIDVLGPDAKSRLMEDPDVSTIAATYLRLDYFASEYELLQSDREDPNYASWLKDIVANDLDDTARKILAENEGTPLEVLEIVNEILAAQSSGEEFALSQRP